MTSGVITSFHVLIAVRTATVACIVFIHQRDNRRLINSLKKLRDAGNTVIVVEHDKDMMLEADYVIDVGPKAGRKGGEVVFQGTPTPLR